MAMTHAQGLTKVADLIDCHMEYELVRNNLTDDEYMTLVNAEQIFRRLATKERLDTMETYQAVLIS